jgi:hypothetical protein
MRKFQLLGVGLVALLALGMFTASASATFLLAKWLVNGVAVTAELLVEGSGELLLEDQKAVLGQPAAVLCSGIGVGWVGPNSLDWISEMLSLNGEAISTTPLSGLPLECTAQTGCETNTSVLVWLIGLPYTSEVELVEQTGGPYFADIGRASTGGNVGWEVTNCLVLGTAHEDECTSTEGASELKLEGTTLLAIASSAFLELIGGKPARCTASGAETGIIAGEGSLTLSGGGELTASSETSVA